MFKKNDVCKYRLSEVPIKTYSNKRQVSLYLEEDIISYIDMQCKAFNTSRNVIANMMLKEYRNIVLKAMSEGEIVIKCEIEEK